MDQILFKKGEEKKGKKRTKKKYSSENDNTHSSNEAKSQQIYRILSVVNCESEIQECYFYV